MDSYEKHDLFQHSESFCKMCGLCCRVATTAISYSSLLKMSEEGDKSANDFLALFEPYSSVEEARKVSSETVDNIINRFAEEGNYSKEDITFYRCKYLSDDNLCTKYENREDSCKYFPASPWAIVPPGCGYEGLLFIKREEIKQKIRKIKEELLELQLLKAKTTSQDVLLKIASVEKKMLAAIEQYKMHGSYNW